MVVTNAGVPFKESFLEGMRQAGQVEGRTFQFELRVASEPISVLALIRASVVERPAVLVVTGVTAARHARDATATVPVVVATASDLVDASIVKSFARPRGNITGVSDQTDETSVKRLELLKAALPNASRVALLINPDSPATPKVESRVESAARSLRITIARLYARDRASLLLALDSLEKSRPDAMLIGGDALFSVNAEETIERASALRVPVERIG